MSQENHRPAWIFQKREINDWLFIEIAVTFWKAKREAAMKKAISLSAIVLLPWLLMGQSLLITFTGIDETVVINSITATNMATGETTTLPGNETLLLNPVSGIDLVDFDFNSIMLYPNPVSDHSKLVVSKEKAGEIRINIQTLLGQTIIYMEKFLQAGSHTFELSLDQPGVYLIIYESDDYQSNIKAVCNISNRSKARIKYTGSRQESLQGLKDSKAKTIVAALSYTPGDVIHYKCLSGEYTTIFTDTPSESKTYTVKFFECKDASEESYEVVMIGEQFWMAENLACLPSVNNPYEESYTDPRYYVYGYDGNLVSEATATYNYADYGVLYNWEAAKVSCPEGWHLPSEAEWMILVNSLGEDGGAKMKSSYWWNFQGSGNNYSGFNGFPGGRRSMNEFLDLGEAAYFWSSTGEGAFNARGRGLHYSYDIVANLFSGIHVGLSVRCVKD